MDFARAAANVGPCSRTEITMVERKMTGNTEIIPLRSAPMFERETAIAMMIPASSPRRSIFVGV